MSRGFASNYRIYVVAIGLFACFAGLGARLVCLHVLDREELVKAIVQTRRQDTRDTARRGDILDRSGTILATTRPMILLAVDPLMVRPEDLEKLPELARILNLPLAEVQRLFTTKYRTVTVKPANDGVGALAANTTPGLKFELPKPAAKVAPETAAGDDSPADVEFRRALVTTNDAPGAAAEAAEADTKAAPASETSEVPETRQRAIRWAKLSDHVSESDYAEIEKLGLRSLCPPDRRFARIYPHEEMASHLIGFANRENRGVAGIEAYADFYLRGQDGWREGEKDGRRRELAQFQTRDIPRADGYSVILTIDSVVQDIVEQEIEKIAQTYAPLKATIIVSRPSTGEILGLANYPTFNPNTYHTIPKEEMNRMKNVAVSDVYEPGSVFKIVAASAAIEEKLVGPDTRFNCSTETLTFPWRRGQIVEVPMREDHHFDHPLTIAEIVAKSSNRGAAQLALRVGDEKFEAYARAFGFGERLGFPVGGEVPGIFRHHDKWGAKDFTRIAMGQAIAATALQMHQAMSTIASGGVLLQPRIISEIRDTSKSVVYRYDRTEIHRVISEQTARTVTKLLQGVASPLGTAPDAAIKINGIDYEVAGKTATAQKYIKQMTASGKEKWAASTRNHVVSFVGFFPASHPQVAISVIVDDADHRCPGGVAYGAAVAAPVFKRIGEKLIPILSITPPSQPARLDFVAATEGGRR